MPQETSSGEIWSPCDGLFTMPLPPGWRYEPRDYTDGSFRLASGQRLFCRVDSLETPEAIASGRSNEFVGEPGLDGPPLDDGDITGNVLMFIKRAKAGAPAELVWKTVDVLEDRYLRTVRMALPLDSAESDEPPDRAHFAAEVASAIGQGVFADSAKPLDRVAPTTSLKRVAPWGLIYMRVPDFWRYERVEDGRFVCDVLPEDAPPDPTLWFDYNLFTAPESESDLPGKVRETAQGLAASWESPDQVKLDLDDRGGWLEAVGYGEEDGTALVYFNMHRLLADAPYFITAQFSLVMTAEDAKTSAGRDVIDLMHHEIHNSIVLARPPSER